MKLLYKNGITSVILRVKIMDSTSTSGGSKTGLSSTSGGLIISTIADNEATATAYTQAGSTIESITTLGTFAAPTATKCRFKEVDATNHPGVYEIQIADARWAVSSARSAIVTVSGATGAAQVDAEVQLTGAGDFGVNASQVGGQTASAAGTVTFPGTIASATNITAASGVSLAADQAVNITKWNGTAVASPATAGVPEVNIKNINNVAASSVTTVGANVGTTQPVNFTGTGASALAKSDMVDVAGAAVSTSSAQIGANAVNVGGTAQTGRDLGASVLLSSGTGTGQLDFTSGVVKSNLAQILGTALTETAGLLAGGFKKFFNISSPTATMDHGVLVDTVTTYTGNTVQTGDSYGRIGAAGAGLTAITGAQLAADQAVNATKWAGLATVALPLVPTVAGRTLDVSAGGEAGVDWGNVGSPTTTLGLTGTTVKTATDVETDTQDIQARIPAALTANGNIKADALRVNGTAQTAGDLAALINANTGLLEADVVVDTSASPWRLILYATGTYGGLNTILLDQSMYQADGTAFDDSASQKLGQKLLT